MTIRWRVCVLAGILSAVAWGEGRHKEGSPWDAASLEVGPKVIYGTDDRHDVFEEADAERRSWAMSTCGLVDDEQLTENEDGSFTLETYAFSVGAPICEGEPYVDQPTAPYCTGFVVGSDLIATAGHCFSEIDLEYTRFVFGFQMTDATTPVTQFAANRVYRGVELVASEFASDDTDFSVIRVDRPIAAPGAQVLEIRRSGAIAPGTRVGVIGHPWGLPTKIAFGEATTVRESPSGIYFVTNLDTYGGNSGSPVFNAETGIVEGILVRGAPDFAYDGDCVRSNVLSNTGGRGEDVTRSVTFAEYVPGGRGQLSLDRAAYRCDDTIAINLFDLHLAGVGSTEVTGSSSGGDVETVMLTETEVLGQFFGALPVQATATDDEDGTLGALEGDSVFVVYADADDGTGTPVLIERTAAIDCTSPAIGEISIERATGRTITIAFETDEATLATVRMGTQCGNPTNENSDGLATMHHATVRELEPLTTYRFVVEVADPAGNTTVDDNEGMCFEANTVEQVDSLTEEFFDFDTDLEGTSLTLVPDDSEAGYNACLSDAGELPSDSMCGTRVRMTDDSVYEYALPDGKTFAFFGEEYNRFFLNSNGNITFGEGDRTFFATAETHFARPRISGLFDDLFPHDGGEITISPFDDRVVVTFDEVMSYTGYPQTFQMELFFEDGSIRITWIDLNEVTGVVGISRGQGIPEDFESSNISGYTTCEGVVAGGAVCANNDIMIVCSAAGGAFDGSAMTGDMLTFGVAVLAWIAMRRRRALG